LVIYERGTEDVTEVVDIFWVCVIRASSRLNVTHIEADLVDRMGIPAYAAFGKAKTEAC
jgi:hypothetical protein